MHILNFEHSKKNYNNNVKKDENVNTPRICSIGSGWFLSGFMHGMWAYITKRKMMDLQSLRTFTIH